HRPPSDKLPDELLLLQRVQRALHSGFRDFHYRLTIRFLIARRNQRIERERVVLRRPNLLLGQTAEDPDLERVELPRRHPPRFSLAAHIGHGREGHRANLIPSRLGEGSAAYLRGGSLASLGIS